MWQENGIKKPHAQKFGDREHEAVGKKNCIRNNSKIPTLAIAKL